MNMEQMQEDAGKASLDRLREIAGATPHSTPHKVGEQIHLEELKKIQAERLARDEAAVRAAHDGRASLTHDQMRAQAMKDQEAIDEINAQLNKDLEEMSKPN